MSMMKMRGSFVKVEWTKDSKLERNLMIIIHKRNTGIPISIIDIKSGDFEIEGFSYEEINEILKHFCIL